MIINNDFKPNPSNFADFVYCGVYWVLSHNDLKPTVHHPLSEGKKNEHKCIDWVCNEYHISTDQILFNGTGENNPKPLTSEIGSVDMSCKPDLIISKANRNLLFEFKSVGKPEYLDMYEFDSVHAQVWCYTKLKEKQIDEYHLLRYYIDPCVKFRLPSPRRYTNKTYDHKLLSFNQVESSRFESLLKKYIKIIETYKLDNSERKKIVLADLGTFSAITSLPTEHYIKCRKCRLNYKCDLYEKTYYV